MVKNITLTVLLLFSVLTIIGQPPSQTNMDKAREHFNQGLKYGVSLDYAEAIKEFSSAIELNPLFAEAFLYKGLAKIEISDYDQAIKDLTVAIELDPAFSDQAHYFRGIARFNLQDFSGSIDDLSVAIRMNPDFVAFFQRGKANLELKEYKRSLQDFEISLRLNPEFYEAYLYRGINLYYLNEREDAIEDLEIAKKHLPNNPKVWYYSGLVRTGVQNSYVAIEDLNRAIELDPSYSEAFAARAVAKVNTGNPETAHADQVKAQLLQEQATQTSITAVHPANHTGQQSTTLTAATDINFAGLFVKQEKTEPETNTTTPQDQVVTVGSAVARINAPVVQDQSIPVSRNINEKEAGIYNNNLERISATGFGVQVASYSNTDNLLKLADAYQQKYDVPVAISISNVNGRKLYKLIIGQFAARAQAEALRDHLRGDSFPDSFLVVYENL